MSHHKISCSLHGGNLPEGRGVTLVRRYVVFNFCWCCFRKRRNECERFMEAQAGPLKKTIFERAATALPRSAVICAALGMLLSSAGCGAGKKPRHIEPVIFRHCAVTTQAAGILGCDCPNPLLVWDAKLRRKVVYCDGKIQ
jgi:hypothetical protein